MKKILFIFSFFFFTCSFGQQKNYGIVNYESKISKKAIENYMTNKRPKIKNKVVLKNLDQTYLYSGVIQSNLYFAGTRGVFTVEDKLSTDINEIGQRISQVSSGGSNIYYYDQKNKIYLIKNCETLGECFIYDNKLFEWQLTQETKIINNYKAFKATRSNGKVIAWYTPQIPVGFGPKGEYGLPGLILELEIGNIVFNATKISLNPKEKIVVKEPKRGKRVSFAEYKKLIDKAKKSIFGN